MNLLIHEILWHGVLRHRYHRGEKGDFPNTIPRIDQDVDLEGHIDNIRDAFESERD